MILVVHLVASPAVNKLKTVGNQQDNYMLTKELGAQKRLMVPIVGVKTCQPFNYS
jgi:hypothetical protein